MRSRTFIYRLTFTALVGLAVSMPASLTAQSIKTGTRKELHDAMTCVAKRNEPMMRAMTLGKAGAFEKAVTSGKIWDQSCYGGKSLRFEGISFLDPIAETLLKREFPNEVAVVADVDMQPLKASVSSELDADRKGKSEQWLNMLRRQLLGFCLLERNEATALKLLTTEIESESERQTITVLTDDIDRCLTQDYSAELTFDELRGAVATARYRLLHRAKSANDA